MRYLLLGLCCFLLSSCYSDGCLFLPQSVHCVDKGELYPLMAGYQKPETLGKTDSEQRWKDWVSCGGKYGDVRFEYFPRDYVIDGVFYKDITYCMKNKKYIFFNSAQCGYQTPKWDEGVCNL